LLRGQKDFKEEMTLCSPASQDAVSISLREHKGNADGYNIRVYEEVLKAQGNVIDGPPRVQTFDTSTLATFTRPSSKSHKDVVPEGGSARLSGGVCRSTLPKDHRRWGQ
jgi:hypothetical protein